MNIESDYNVSISFSKQYHWHINKVIHSFVHPFIHSFIHSFTYSFIDSD